MPERPVYEEHPELHHYTDWGGLSGMVTNRTIWATRYNQMNDRTEVEHLRDRLVPAVKRALIPVLDKMAAGNRNYLKQITAQGGAEKVAENEAHALINAAYKVTFQGAPDSHPFAIPYIASFCSHCTDDTYLKENGLLSQWRGYGGNAADIERYAVVFETKPLVDALLKESEQFAILFGQVGDVVYNDETINFEDRFPEVARLFSDSYEAYHRDNENEMFDQKFHSALMSAATRFKHRAFKEEREVRAVVAPLTAELKAYLKAKTGIEEAPGKLLKPIKSRDRGGTQISYVALLEEQAQPLPIRRIIVGPCPDQKAAVARAEKLVGGKIDIKVSDTPFLG